MQTNIRNQNSLSTLLNIYSTAAKDSCSMMIHIFLMLQNIGIAYLKALAAEKFIFCIFSTCIKRAIMEIAYWKVRYSYAGNG